MSSLQELYRLFGAKLLMKASTYSITWSALPTSDWSACLVHLCPFELFKTDSFRRRKINVRRTFSTLFPISEVCH